ncbi:restriction endonuclease subunit S [Streptomyces californicus]|uniref:restriction endonuclease subunit S n=1 Tax=Streptomyces californicus TaxID=67351 RepID=UPI0036B0358D
MKTLPLKYVARVNAGQSPSSSEVSDLVAGRPFLQGNAEFRAISPSPRYECESAPKVASVGDILLSVRAPVGALNIADMPYGIGRGLCAITAEGCNSRFLWWWLHHARARLDAVSTGSTYRAVTAEDVEALPYPTLPESEQHRIADFLDVETARIARLESVREEQLNLLRHRAVAQLSEVERILGDRYGTIPLRYMLIRCEQGWSPQCEDRHISDGEWGVVKAGCVNSGSFDVSQHKALPSGIEPRREYALKEGDLLMSRASGSTELIGSVGVVPHLREKMLLCDKVYRLVLDPTRGEPGFVSHMLRTQSVREHIKMGISGGEGLANNLPTSVVKSCLIPNVPVREQRGTANSLEADSLVVARTWSALRRSIDLLAERRQSLITAAVTGQFDVSTAGGRSVTE